MGLRAAHYIWDFVSFRMSLTVRSLHIGWRESYLYHISSRESFLYITLLLPRFPILFQVRVQQCIADLFHTTILLSRSEALLSCPSTQLLYTITVDRSVKDQTALSTITKALTLLLVLPWQQTKEQRWEERAAHFEGYTGKLFAPLQTVWDYEILFLANAL